MSGFIRTKVFSCFIRIPMPPCCDEPCCDEEPDGSLGEHGGADGTAARRMRHGRVASWGPSRARAMLTLVMELRPRED